MRIPDYTVSQFSGLNTFIKDLKTLKPGVATDSLNWVTGKYGDHIELRRGSALLGNTRIDGAGKITGIGVGTRYDGAQVPFWSRGRKIEYYDAAADDRAEVGSDILPVAADGEDCWFSPYANLAGSMMYAGSPNSGIYKVPVANPGSPVDQLVNNFRFGVLRFGQGRAFAGQRNGTTAGNLDKTGLYLSDIDKANLSLYAQVTAESIGIAGATGYSGILSERTGKRTAMYVAVKEAGGETLTDDRNGTLVGNQGSTGTINYATGAYNPAHRYAIGADTGKGNGNDHSTAVLMDFSTIPARQAGSYANNLIPADQFAYELKRQADLFGSCLIAPEKNSESGGSCLTTLKMIYDANMIYRQVPLDRLSDQPLGSGELDWETNGATKYSILNDLRTAVEDGHLLIQDERILLEMKSFTFTDADDLGRSRVGHFTNHFDLLMATAIAWEMRKHAKAKQVTAAYEQEPYERTGL